MPSKSAQRDDNSNAKKHCDQKSEIVGQCFFALGMGAASYSPYVRIKRGAVHALTVGLNLDDLKNWDKDGNFVLELCRLVGRFAAEEADSDNRATIVFCDLQKAFRAVRDANCRRAGDFEAFGKYCTKGDLVDPGHD